MFLSAYSFAYLLVGLFICLCVSLSAYVLAYLLIRLLKWYFKSLVSFQTVAQQTQTAAQTQLALLRLDLSNEYKEKFWCSKLGGNKTNTKPSFSNISKAKACILAKTSRSSSKDKVQPSESKAKASGSKAKSSGSKAKASPKTINVKSPVPITNFILGLANAKTWDGILNKTFGVKIPTTMAAAKEKKGKRKMGGGS
ncbi:hypothetical protein Tco_0003321 [Tanacetum coccineum]